MPFSIDAQLRKCPFGRFGSSELCGTYIHAKHSESAGPDNAGVQPPAGCTSCLSLRASAEEAFFGNSAAVSYSVVYVLQIQELLLLTTLP